MLRIEFETAEKFQREYQSNLSNGGLFVATHLDFELRELVEVDLVFPYAHRSIQLEGEVVDVSPVGLTALSGRSGVAVQLLLGLRELRERLGALVEEAERADPPDAGRRAAPRKPVRVASQIRGHRGAISGRTRNLSLTGVLVDLDGPPPPLLDAVGVVLTHPSRGERRTLPGTVVRHIESGGEVSAVAVQFSAEAIADEATVAYLEEVQAFEQTRRLGAISGPIDPLGPRGVLQMFATSSPRGTLTLRNGQDEGVIVFGDGLLRTARLGALCGLKALVRMLSWRDGAFEFRAGVEPEDRSGPPLPLDAALLEALRQIDEDTRMARRHFPLRARLRHRSGGNPAADGSLSKVEAALIDLARANSSVQRALEVIPEPDPEILRALQGLVEAGLVALET